MTSASANRIRRALDHFQVAAPAQSDQIPALPEDVTEIDDSGLMVLYGRLVGWCEYADLILADASAMERKSEQDVVYAEAGHTSLSGQKTVAARRAEAALDEHVQDAQNDLLIAYHHRKRAEAAVKLVERRLALVSREITRRSAGARGRTP